MLPKCGIQILLNSAVSQNLGISKITRRFNCCSDDDIQLLQIALDFDLNISFYDITNYTLDYALAGHVALLSDQDMLVIALPPTLSDHQQQHLQQMKDELKHRYMIIYSLEDRQIENLHLFYGQEKDGKNQQLLEQVLVSKSEAIPSPKVYKKRIL